MDQQDRIRIRDSADRKVALLSVIFVFVSVLAPFGILTYIDEKDRVVEKEVPVLPTELPLTPVPTTAKVVATKRAKKKSPTLSTSKRLTYKASVRPSSQKPKVTSVKPKTSSKTTTPKVTSTKPKPTTTTKTSGS